MKALDRLVVVTYWAFTTLSTIGLGDYHPVSDYERICASFVLLFGVALFSFIMGELLAMIDKFNALYHNDFNEEDSLDKFFILLRYFNHT